MNSAQPANVSRLAASSINLIERGLMPDPLIRAGIRRLCAQRLVEISADDAEMAGIAGELFARQMESAEIAPLPRLANEQHYEVPAEFFKHVLGPHRKYSSAWWPQGTASLAEAEHAALEATAQRAQLTDGQNVLELGCGWGFADVVDGRTVSGKPHHGGFQLALAARVHSRARRRAGAGQCRGPDCRHE